MPKSIFGTVVAFTIVSLFVTASMVPILESVALGKNNSSEPLFYAREPPQSVDDHLMVKRSLTGLAPTSQTTRNSQYVLQSFQPEFHPSAPLGEVIFSQGYYLPTESWNFYTSDLGLGWYVQEDFWDVADEIGDIEWYGLDFNWNTYVPGNPTGMTFNIIFYEDSGGAPGAEVANFANIEPTFVDTGLAYSSWGDMWFWQFELPSTVTLAAGWVGIQSTYCPDGSMFLWAVGPDGNLNGRQNGASVGANFAYSLTAPNIQYDHDIVISSIVAPVSGGAAPITPIVKVKNAGLFTEYSVPVQFEIGKETVSGTIENFEATDGGYIHYPKLPQPDVWAWGAPTSGPMAAYSGSNLWATNLAGAYPPSMWCILQTTPFVVPSGAMFNFWQWYYFEANYDGGNVKISNDGGATYTIITPVGGYPGTMSYNPFMTGQPVFNGQSGGWKQANFDLSAYEGQTCQIIFETASDSSVQYDGWYIDDVGFSSTSWLNEYNQTIILPFINSNETLEISFPEWIPADLGMVENTNINYNAEATNLFIDNNTDNDYKAKPFTLHYGYLHDVALNEIISPESGLATQQTPEVVIENHGQNDESVNVSMTIGKPIYTTLLEEDFAGGVPPAGWATDAPTHWMGSSTNYAGGTAPEAEFYYLNSDIGDFHLYTGIIDTTGFTALGLNFKEMVNDYNGDYTLKVQTSTDGGVTWSDAYVRAGGFYGPATTEITLTTANGVGSPTLQISWTYSGNAFNINYWYIDDVWMGIIDMVNEYDQIVTVDIAAGASMNVTLPEWTPTDIPLGTTIDYLIDASVCMNVTDGNPADNELAKMITLSYEHDVGVIEITEPSWSLKRTSALFWTDATDGDMVFQLSGQQQWGGPGTYPIEGIIQNFGVTYSEIDFPVNAQFELNGVVIYDETVVASGPLLPGALTAVVFPDVTIPEEHYVDWKLTMQTQLANDDHPNNNKKIKTGSGGIDTYPPVTTAVVTGTMGHNGWYISCVTVTLYAEDLKWPNGVNHTYYKIDNGNWNEYTLPIIVCEDGEHTVYFYSDDRAMPPNIEEEKNVTFKIDQTPPSISMSVEKVGFRQYEFTATVSDMTSGMWYVELYFDDMFLENLSAPGPYEWNWTGKGNHTVTGIAYDIAGNSAENSVTVSLDLSQQHSLFNQVVSQAYRFIQLLKTIIMKLGMDGVRLLS